MSFMILVRGSSLKKDMLALKQQYMEARVSEDTKKKGLPEPRVALHALLLLALSKEVPLHPGMKEALAFSSDVLSVAIVRLRARRPTPP
eukprot:741601-Amphidinium_carterae.1